MSFQTINDILTVNSFSNSEYQTTKLTNNSPNNLQTTSFSDLLSSYNNEVSASKNENTSKIDEKNETSVKYEDKTEIKTEEKSESVEKSETKDEVDSSKVEEKSAKTEKSEKNSVDSKKDDKKEFNSDKTVLKNEGKVSENKDKKSKIKKEDFSKLDELTQKIDENGKILVSKSENNQELKNSVKKSKEENTKEIDFTENDLISSDSNENIANLLVTDGSKNAEDTDLDFSFDKGNKNSERKIASLDKEGKITVEDLRTELTDAIEKNEKTDLKISDVKINNDNSAVITMDLNQNVNADVLSTNSQVASSNGSNFQAMLNNQIQANVPEFVKTGSIILKDNNQGTINLVLHPDDLGNVKIHLSLDGKTLSGHITVASKEAMEVFKDNSETLREAFIKNGFENANIDISFSNNSSFAQNDSSQFESNRNEHSSFAIKNAYGSVESADFETESLDNEKFSNYSINIVA